MVRVANGRGFEYFIAMVIAVSSGSLALDTPLNEEGGRLVRVLTIIDVFVTVIFAVEAVIKIIAVGFVNNGPKSYLRDTFNFLDFIILIPSLIFYLPHLHIPRKTALLLRAVRILRPARFFNKSENLQ
jgi:hypothetical protein